MDIIDLKIIKILLRNSRTSYREIANELNLTVNAIHKRVQKMNEIGVIRKYTAKPNLANLLGHHILICGKSNAKSLTEISKELGQHPSIFFVGISGGKFLHIDGELENLDDLQNYVTFVKETAELEEPFVGQINQPLVNKPEIFTNNDKMILHSLQEDGRKSTIEIAEEINLSTKTVRKALKRMEEKNMVDFSIHWAPDSEKDYIGHFEILLKKEQKVQQEILKLLNDYPNIVYFQTFSNEPNSIMLTTWHDTSKKTQTFHEELETLGYSEVILRVIYNGYFFETWRTKYIEEL